MSWLLINDFCTWQILGQYLSLKCFLVCFKHNSFNYQYIQVKELIQMSILILNTKTLD
ncbi:hypothetical protein M758_4G254300 [Ceratodon purpureus]|nr:hypothetical protein M758_4G254300 [Ceratodon purpureus]